MIYRKLTKEEFEELISYEPGKMLTDYAEYERRYDEELQRLKAQSITLDELDAIIQSKLYPLP